VVAPITTLDVAGLTATVVSTGGGCVTVTVAEPLLPPLLAVMVAVPAATAVTRPLDDTVAIAVLELAQVNVTPLIVVPFWSFAVAASCALAPGSRLTVAGVTAMVVRTGAGGATLTVEDALGEVLADGPDVAPLLAVMAAEPAPTPVTRPLAETVATDGFALAQVKVTPLIVLPY
jgi:hypothetical protein